MKPDLMHPLCGCDPATLVRLLRASGPPSAAGAMPLALVLLVTAARLPFSAIEHLGVAWARRRMAPMPPPIFIIGHWRSGTTHLQNIMSRDPQFGSISPLAAGLPWDLLGLASGLRPLLERALPSDRYIDRVAVRPDSPQEDEIALASMAPLSYYHGLYFPKDFERHFRRGVFFDDCHPDEIWLWQRRHRLFLEKVTIHQRGKRLLVKNPVYTARLAMLRAMWPGARFIHIHRNPYLVFESTKHFYTKLLEHLALQQVGALALDDFVVASYRRLMSQFVEDSADLAPGELAEVRFDDFEADPLGELARVYAQLQIDGFALARPRFETYLATIRDYRKNRYAISADTVSRVAGAWQPFLDRWGYTPPAAVAGERARPAAALAGSRAVR